MSCSHATTTLRYRADSLGRRLFARQCDQCLGRVGDWLSHRLVQNTDVPAWVESADQASFAFNRTPGPSSGVARTHPRGRAPCDECGEPTGFDGRRTCMCGLRVVLRAVGRETEAALAVVDAAREEIRTGRCSSRLQAALCAYDEAVRVRMEAA